MSNYVKSTNFAIKDSLVTTDPSKIIKGTDIDNEYNAIANAIASKADTNSPGLTGTPTAPTATAGSNTNQLANTNFVTAALATLIPTGIITLWSGAVAAVPVGWALCNGSSGTPDLRDRFVVGAGSSYAVGATGGANTVTLDATMIPSHTHSLTASGTTSGHSNDHTHSGTTSAVSNDHTHGFDVYSGAMSANNTHSHNVNDPGHSHGGVPIIDGDVNPGVSPSRLVQNYTNSSVAYTGISVSTVDINHVHRVTGNTGGISANHTHTITTGGVSANHTHTVTVTGTSGATGGGSAHENRPPYYALAYIMKI